MMLRLFVAFSLSVRLSVCVWLCVAVSLCVCLYRALGGGGGVYARVASDCLSSDILSWLALPRRRGRRETICVVDHCSNNTHATIA